MAAAALSMQTLDVNGLRMQIAVQGSGPLVLLCHGFPELWISWRAQLDALAAAGYRVVEMCIRDSIAAYAYFPGRRQRRALVVLSGRHVHPGNVSGLSPNSG